MKTSPPFFVLAVLLSAALFSTFAVAQNASLRPPRGGFDRPLADTPRFGNPGASPKLTAVEFNALLAHWADYDANKNKRFDKVEAPELFAALFDQADANHDGALDEKERIAVNGPKVAPKPAVPPKVSQSSAPVPEPLKRMLFGDPVFGAPPIPTPAR